MTVVERARVVAALAAAGCISPDEEADELLEAAHGDRDLLDRLIDRRGTGEPLEWIVGSLSFCGTRIHLDPGVYVPRWHTEALVRRAAELLPRGGLVVDLCTGSGAIPAALAAMRPDARILATDIDPTAVGCARANGVDVRVGDLDTALPTTIAGTVDVMTAVVPYVPTDALQLLPRDVQAFEPRHALDGGAGGTRLLERVIERSVAWLRPGAWLLLELGGDQSQPMLAKMRAVGFGETRVLRDAEYDDRGVEGRLP